jgi:thiamine pyrophosphate-dependent acetolactate synthase large subunit-like protein
MLAMTWQLLPTAEELEAQKGTPKARRWYCVWLCKTTQSDKEIERRERRDYKAQTKNDMYVLEKMAEQAVSDGTAVTDVVEPTVTAQSFTFGSTGQLP